MTDIEKAEMLLAYAKHREHLTMLVVADDGQIAIVTDFEAALQLILEGREPYFDTDRHWPYPPETREGVPVWVRYSISFETGDSRDGATTEWIFYRDIRDTRSDTRFEQAVVINIVAADPRNLQEPPPNDLPPKAKG